MNTQKIKEFFKNAKQTTIKTIKKENKKILIIIIIVALAALLVVGGAYILKLIRGKEDANNKKNAPGAARNYMNSISINEEGKMETEKTVRELWEQLVEDENDITKYIDSPEELAKLLNVEVATGYIYTGDYKDDDPANVNLEVRRILEDINSTEVQGLIKLKRAYGNIGHLIEGMEDGDEEYITYIEPNKFNEMVAQNDKEVLRHFTLEKKEVENENSSNNSERDTKIKFNNETLCWPIPNGITYGVGTPYNWRRNL